TRSRARGIALTSRRREVQPVRALTPPLGTLDQAIPARHADNLRAWCDVRTKRGTHGVDRPAAESVHRILNSAREQLEMELAWLSRFVNGRYVFEAFAGEASHFRLNLNTEIALADTSCIRVLDGRLPSVLPDTVADSRTAHLPPTYELHLGAYVGAPVFVRHGELFGMLCAVSRTPEPSLRHRDAKLLRMLAG